MACEVVEVPTACDLVQHEETDIEQKHTSVRGHQIPESTAADFLFVPLENDRKVCAKRHEFPYDKKDERILDDDYKLQRDDQ